MKTIIGFFILILSVALARAGEGSSLIMASAEDLRPTQMVVGMQAVARKQNRLGELSHEQRIKYLRRHPVPVIIGPKGDLYMIDHHHLSRALLESGHHRLYVQVIGDWSNLSPGEFWNEMEASNYVYLRDERGRLISPQELPNSVLNLKDDPFRSLAYFVREKGGYLNTTTPFAEFKWARSSGLCRRQELSVALQCGRLAGSGLA